MTIIQIIILYKYITYTKKLIKNIKSRNIEWKHDELREKLTRNSDCHFNGFSMKEIVIKYPIFTHQSKINNAINSYSDDRYTRIIFCQRYSGGFVFGKPPSN